MWTGSGPIAHIPTIAAAVAVALCDVAADALGVLAVEHVLGGHRAERHDQAPITRLRKCENRSSFSMLW